MTRGFNFSESWISCTETPAKRYGRIAYDMKPWSTSRCRIWGTNGFSSLSHGPMDMATDESLRHTPQLQRRHGVGIGWFYGQWFFWLVYIYIYIEREWYLSMIYVVEYTVVCMRMAQKYATSLILLTYGSRWNSSYCRRVLGFDPSPVPLPFLEMATFESSDVKTGTALCCWKTNPADTMGWLWSCFAFACCSSKNRPPLAYHITLPYFTWLWRRFATSLFYADWPINHQSILLHHHAAARPGERVAGLGWGGCEWTLWGLFSIKPFEGPF